MTLVSFKSARLSWDTFIARGGLDKKGNGKDLRDCRMFWNDVEVSKRIEKGHLVISWLLQVGSS